MIIIVVGVFGTVLEGLKRNLEELEIKGIMETIQTVV